MKYMIAIFDLDGTILNTLEDLADSTNYALKTCGYPERTMDEVRQFVGNGIRKLMERAVPEGTPVEEIDRVHETFTAHYKVHCADKTRPYDGIMELLQNLKKDGCKLAVCLIRQIMVCRSCVSSILTACLILLWESGKASARNRRRILSMRC